MISPGRPYILTLSEWVYSADGRRCGSVAGTCEVILASTVGIVQSRSHANWFVKVGDDQEHVIIPGCKVSGCHLLTGPVAPTTTVLPISSSDIKSQYPVLVLPGARLRSNYLKGDHG